jgi:hypothetical protein
MISPLKIKEKLAKAWATESNHDVQQHHIRQTAIIDIRGSSGGMIEVTRFLSNAPV